jgi:hypothetical protein
MTLSMPSALNSIYSTPCPFKMRICHKVWYLHVSCLGHPERINIVFSFILNSQKWKDQTGHMNETNPLILMHAWYKDWYFRMSCLYNEYFLDELRTILMYEWRPAQYRIPSIGHRRALIMTWSSILLQRCNVRRGIIMMHETAIKDSKKRPL